MVPGEFDFGSALYAADRKPGDRSVELGGLIETAAVIDALKSRHLGALAIDVYEQESALFFRDRSGDIQRLGRTQTVHGKCCAVSAREDEEGAVPPPRETSGTPCRTHFAVRERPVSSFSIANESLYATGPVSIPGSIQCSVTECFVRPS